MPGHNLDQHELISVTMLYVGVNVNMLSGIQAVLEATIEAAKRDGKYDEGIVDVSGSTISLTSPPQTVRMVRDDFPVLRFVFGSRC